MRYFNSILLMLAFCAPTVAQKVAFDLYNGRDLVGHASTTSVDPLLPTLLHSLLGIQFDALLGSDRSLILSDCGSASQWCADPDYSFPKIFTRAAASLKLPANDLMKSWRISAISDYNFRGDLDPWDGTINQIPLQLLAIVNRIDLARWEFNDWRDAELRFVYGGAPTIDGYPRKFTLIVEFVLPPKSWKQMKGLAGKWRDVGSATGPDFPKVLRDALQQSGYEHSQFVRIRTNVDQNGPWKLAEWDLTPGLTPDPRQALPNSPMVDQFGDHYAQAKPGTITYNAFKTLWKDLGSTPGPKHISIPGFYLETAPVTYKATVYDPPLGAPKNYCAAESTRNVLALQRCTGCHENETNPTNGDFGFTHISNRAPSGSSRLSPFLIGKNGGKPLTLQQIYFGEGAVEVKVTYDNYTRGFGTGKCDTPMNPSPTVTRKYYDLGRRRLFLAAVLAAKTKPNSEDIKKIQEFHTDYSH